MSEQEPKEPPAAAQPASPKMILQQLEQNVSKAAADDKTAPPETPQAPETALPQPQAPEQAAFSGDGGMPIITDAMRRLDELLARFRKT